ncbi:MAG: beta-ketoacyl synthase chain length factor [Burkholderiales bacterium]
MTILGAYLNGIGLLAPGMPGWQQSRRILAQQQNFLPSTVTLPSPDLLPAAERRRSSAIVKLTLAVGLEAANAAGIDPAALPCVYVSSGGDGYNCHEICQTLASDDRHISPTRFHNSVHNAAPGYWGIATGAMTPISVLAAADASFGAGLLELLATVATNRTSTLLIACDTPYPEPLHSVRPIPDMFGVALVATAEPGEHSIAHIRIELTRADADTLTDPGLEAMRLNIPAARSLPLLQALAKAQTARLVLDYLDQTRIAIELTPC